MGQRKKKKKDEEKSRRKGVRKRRHRDLVAPKDTPGILGKCLGYDSHFTADICACTGGERGRQRQPEKSCCWMAIAVSTAKSF